MEKPVHNVFFVNEDIALLRKQSPSPPAAAPEEMRTGVPADFFSKPIDQSEFFPAASRVLSNQQNLVPPESFIDKAAAEAAEEDEPPNLLDPKPEKSDVDAFLEVLDVKDEVVSKLAPPHEPSPDLSPKMSETSSFEELSKKYPAARIKVLINDGNNISFMPPPAPSFECDTIRLRASLPSGAPSGVVVKERVLRRLDLSNRRMTALPPAEELEGVEALDLSGNLLKSLEGLPECVKVVNVSRNRLQSLKGLPLGVQEVNASGNLLEGVLAVPRTVEELDVSNNIWLTKLAVRGLSLEVLNAENCRIAELGQLPPGLRVLNLASNALESFPPVHLPLEELDLSGNQIVRLEFLPRTLRRLNVVNNPLESIADVWDMVLEKLQINSNEASDSTLRQFAELVNSGKWAAARYSTSTQYYLNYKSLFERLSGDELDSVCRMLNLKFHPKLHEIAVRRGLNTFFYTPPTECAQYAYRSLVHCS